MGETAGNVRQLLRQGRFARTCTGPRLMTHRARAMTALRTWQHIIDDIQQVLQER